MPSTGAGARPSDLELLAIQAETVLDERGRLRDLCGLMLGTATEGQVLLVGSRVPDALAAELDASVAEAQPASAPHVEPPVLPALRALLERACGLLDLHAGPYYVFDGEVRAESSVPIVRSDGPAEARLRGLNPGNWSVDAWDRLLDGTLGPWAMALANERVISICHTPRPLGERAAECGVWTHPEYRGRGHAAAVTAAWADIVRPSGRFLFYSTTAENRSSQRVAARLGLREIGWTWNLASASPGLHDSRHPLMREQPTLRDRASSSKASTP
jgi:RimJ/RimL family protein N-acetyltransferase